jgi:hypothetical protein
MKTPNKAQRPPPISTEDFKARIRAIYQPKTGEPCHCQIGVERDNCSICEGTGQRIDFEAIRARRREEHPCIK